MTKVKFIKYFQGLTVLFPSLILSSLRDKGIQDLAKKYFNVKEKKV